MACISNAAFENNHNLLQYMLCTYYFLEPPDNFNRDLTLGVSLPVSTESLIPAFTHKLQL